MRYCVSVTDSTDNRPLLEHLQRWSGGNIYPVPPTGERGEGALRLQMGDSPAIARYTLRHGSFMEHSSKRAKLDEVSWNVLGHGLLPLASERQRLGTLTDPSPMLAGLWESDGSSAMRLRERGGVLRLAGISLWVSARHQVDLESFRRVFGGGFQPKRDKASRRITGWN